ncbi:cyclic pyranopterin monophosphate synthase MoaC [Aliiroseovarius sp. PrR006]|uniref:cyclic pyranopterin monophosphate synthase MoaC n=1 Tax=Aliiroseovarius sp. PrR006 TaxID=2706883 RepID=UPI0013D71D7A|nr:cyclic pyranopterin monophosphate synthase MoaC [Aliiroseovarius sp. PrR006]NDW54265.1 cyclic pyranopterin monophosphate synthase MoaC [Aliiroseovarius sp. PrR006]
MLTHFDASGHAHMVDVSGKPDSHRVASAEAYVNMCPETLDLVLAGSAAKGDVLGVARIAGIMAAKRTSDLIPLCHPLALTRVAVELTPDPKNARIHICATVGTSGQTGVEMEALTAASVTALTIYDMLKAAEKGMSITGLRLLSKEGGKSGRYDAPDKQEKHDVD